MTEVRWRFPGNNYTADNGLDTVDMETFKKDAMAFRIPKISLRLLFQHLLYKHKSSIIIFLSEFSW